MMGLATVLYAETNIGSYSMPISGGDGRRMANFKAGFFEKRGSEARGRQGTTDEIARQNMAVMERAVLKPTAERPPNITRPRRKRDAVGPYSRVIDRGALGAISGRSRAGRYLRAYEAMLVAHVGGSPTVTQRALIS